LNNETLMLKLSWWLMLVFSMSIAGYAFFTYAVLPLGSVVHPEMKIAFEKNVVAFYCHVFASAIALLLGPFQFSSRLRTKYLKLHRLAGRIYLSVGVLLGGLAGLYVAQFAFGGIVSIVGFSVLAITWLVTGAIALYSIGKKDVVAHRKWMIRNFSLTFAAVTLRIYLGLSVAIGIEFEEFYPLVAWLCWVPNILIADWVFNRDSGESWK